MSSDDEWMPDNGIDDIDEVGNGENSELESKLTPVDRRISKHKKTKKRKGKHSHIYSIYKSQKLAPEKNNTQHIPEEQRNVRRSILRYRDILEDMETEYSKDSALHLYNVYLRHLRSKGVPSPKFTEWPLPLDLVPIPTQSLQFVDENDIEGHNAPIPTTKIRRDAELTPKITVDKTLFIEPKPEDFLDVSERLIGRPYCWYYETPKTDSVVELGLIIDSIFQKKITQKIHDFKHQDHDRGNDKARNDMIESNDELVSDEENENQDHQGHINITNRVRPIVDPPIAMPAQLKSKILSKLNMICDSFIDERRRVRYYQTEDHSNWMDVLAYADHSKTVEKCKRLFQTFKADPYPQALIDDMQLHTRVNIKSERDKVLWAEDDSDASDKNLGNSHNHNSKGNDKGVEGRDTTEAEEKEAEDTIDPGKDGILEDENGDVYFFSDYKPPNKNTTHISEERETRKKARILRKRSLELPAKFPESTPLCYKAPSTQKRFLRDVTTLKLDELYTDFRSNLQMQKEKIDEPIDKFLPPYEKSISQRDITYYADWNTLN